MPRRKKFWLVLIAIAVIAALIYGGQAWWLRKHGGSPQALPNPILDVDKHFSRFPPGFPADPGEAGKKTIQGIDADHDGVRDDVQRWIYAFAPNEPKKQMALRQMTRFYQEYSLNDEFNPDLIARGKEPLDRAVQCIYRTFNDEMHGYAEETYLKAKILNTYSRVKRYWENNDKITTKEMEGDHPRYESPCDNQ
ncbi:MAG: hypothetical protein P4M08_14115 [Oligoflexia bacterium]|nr:hypothetical protein [Oligoflexia bacterium]